MRSYLERYESDEICVDRGCDKEAGKPCQNCADEDAGIPMVLRPSIPEDFKEPPATPPYARCMSDGADPELPENAGRHPAPSRDGITDTIQYLRDLRGAAGTPRGGHCI